MNEYDTPTTDQLLATSEYTFSSLIRTWKSLERLFGQTLYSLGYYSKGKQCIFIFNRYAQIVRLFHST